MSSEQENTRRNGKSVQEASKQKSLGHSAKQRLPKTDLRYWQKAVFLPTYTRKGKRHAAGEYAVKIQHAGRRETFSLGTSNREAAADKAKRIYISLQGLGWEATLAAFKPKATKSVITVGDFLKAVGETTSLKPKTLKDYCRAFRTIVAAVAGIDGGKEKYDYRGGGQKQWLERINAIKLANIEPAKVQAWKIAFLKRAGNDPVKQRAARISVNSLMRQAKSLFTPAILKFIAIDLPVMPFEGVKFEPGQSMRYRTSFNVEEVIRLACEGDKKRDIPPMPDEERKIFLLAVMAGLRRNEIDKLEWSAFRWDENLIRIETTRYLQPKSEDSTDDIGVDPELIAIFRGYFAKAKGNFVVESPVSVRPNAGYSHYRCQRLFDAVLKWLRKNGVTGARPLHSLRKEYGSQICAEHGIYAASRALRHADIAITAQHYLDSRKRVTVGLGRLLKSADNVVAFEKGKLEDLSPASLSSVKEPVQSASS